MTKDKLFKDFNELEALADLLIEKAIMMKAEISKSRGKFNIKKHKFTRRELIGTQAALRRKSLLDNKKYITP